MSTPAAGVAALRGAALRLGGFLAGALVSAVSAALLLHHLGLVDTGRYVTGTSLVAIVAALSDLGLTAVGVREISTRPPEQRWTLAADLLGLRLTLTAVCGALMIVIAWLAYSGQLAAGVALAIAGLMLQATQDNLAMGLMVDLRLGWISALELLRQVLTALVAALLVLIGARLVPFLGMSIPVGLAVVGATVAIVRGSRSLLPHFSPARWRTFIGEMFPYALAVAAGALYFRISILLVSALGSAAQLGNLSASFRIIEVLTLIPGMLISSAFPIFARAARDDRTRLGYALGRVHEVALLAGLWVAVSLAIGAPLIMKVLGGSQFHGAADLLAIQGVGLGAMFVSVVWGNGLVSLGVYRRILTINLAVLALTAGIVAALVLLDGDTGAALGTAAGEVIACVVQAIAVARLDARLRAPLAKLPRALLAAGIALTPLALAPLGVPTIAQLALSACLFVISVRLLRIAPEELRDLLPFGASPAGGRTGAR